jgi:biofilm protein TabA
MLYANLANGFEWEPFIHSPALTRSLLWVSGNARSAAEGIHELGEPGWYVNVHGYSTQPRELCTWENHPSTIDLQFIIEGIEGIDIIPVEALGEPTSFKQESDTQKFAANLSPATQLVLRAGEFVFLMPGEAHRPKVAVEAPVQLKKLVVKIPAKLLGEG